MAEKNALSSRSVKIAILRLNVWERPEKGSPWGASIIDTRTNKVLVKIYRESEREAIGKAGHELYSRIFHSKTFDQVREEARIDASPFDFGVRHKFHR